MGSILNMEMCADSKWVHESEESYELPTMALRLIVDITSRCGTDGMLRINAAERAALFPQTQPYSTVAIEELVAGGRIEFTN